MTRPTQTPGSTSDAKKRLTLVPTPCCDAAAAVARVRELAERWTPGSTHRGCGCAWCDLHADLRAALDGPAGGAS